ncbi:MAG TPA: sugar phosphate isomerase/epimerase [Conexibacter sp.]|nr:sugar phosphate isomerase/epimerase [Conexibacter sp.]
MSAAAVISFHPSVSGAVTVPWRESLPIAAAAGFRAIDVSLAELAHEPPSAVREALQAAGLTAGPASLPVEFRQDEERYRHDLALLPRLAALAAALGVTTMFRSIPASSDVPPAEMLPRLRRRLTVIAGVLREHEIGFALEVLSPLHRRREGAHELIWRLQDGAEFARSCADDAGMLVDSWHWHHARESERDIVALGDAIRHVHVADAADLPPAAVRDEERLLPGDGVIDFTSFFAALDAAGYTGFISPEVRGYQCSMGPAECARAAHAAVRRCMG